MEINFFKKECCQSTTAAQFGVRDDPPPAQTAAYLDFNDEEKWIAVVENTQQKEVLFTALDHCVFPESKKLGRRCDGMITYSNHLILMELKTGSYGPWLKEAQAQLLNTIHLMQDNQFQFTEFQHKTAYVCHQKEFRKGTKSTELKERMEEFRFKFLLPTCPEVLS